MNKPKWLPGQQSYGQDKFAILALMLLREQLEKDLHAAMKAKDETKVSSLRMLKAAIMKFEVSGDKKKDASDDEVMNIIGKEVKQRKESIDAFQKGGREELAKNEEAELKILQAYLPEQMGEEELKKIVQEVISQVGAQSKADFGKVMGPLMGRVKGRADGNMVKKAVESLLS